MLLYIFLCNVLCVPLIYGNNTTPGDSKVQKVLGIKSNVSSIYAEGGSTLLSTPITSKLNHDTVLTNLDKGLGNNNPDAETSTSRRDPRKGVVYGKVDSTVGLNNDITKVNNQISQTKKVNKVVSSTLPLSTEQSHKTSYKPKKPLILSDEALMKAQNMDQTSTSITRPTKKVEPMSPGRHPGMVMPIVITILVVPMFAVLGYMALRRGKEAWKNRHYKRMDFLLDGMYNE